MGFTTEFNKTLQLIESIIHQGLIENCKQDI